MNQEMLKASKAHKVHISTTWANKKSGFTIVELLIVVVVIAILAAITIVAYNGIQLNAKVSSTLSELKSVNTAIQMYHAEKGIYPSTGGAWNGLDQEPNYVPLVVPNYISKLPQLTATVPGGGVGYSPSGTYLPAFAYRSDGTDYKLMAHNDGLCTEVKKKNPSLISTRDCWAYGYWTPGAFSW